MCSGLGPGNDGIPIEFDKTFWNLISDSFTRCVNECFDKGEMSCSQKQAVITLIEKKGKDRLLLENWHPISLVNVDTKIMTKAIAARIKNVLPDIIHCDQTGYVKDRFIGETIRSIYDIMEFTAEENIPGLLVFITRAVRHRVKFWVAFFFIYFIFFFVSRSSKDNAKTFVYDQMTCHMQDGGCKTNDQK